MESETEALEGLLKRQNELEELIRSLKVDQNKNASKSDKEDKEAFTNFEKVIQDQITEKEKQYKEIKKEVGNLGIKIESMKADLRKKMNEAEWKEEKAALIQNIIISIKKPDPKHAAVLQQILPREELSGLIINIFNKEMVKRLILFALQIKKINKLAYKTVLKTIFQQFYNLEIQKDSDGERHLYFVLIYLLVKSGEEAFLNPYKVEKHLLSLATDVTLKESFRIVSNDKHTLGFALIDNKQYLIGGPKSFSFWRLRLNAATLSWQIYDNKWGSICVSDEESRGYKCVIIQHDDAFLEIIPSLNSENIYFRCPEKREYLYVSNHERFEGLGTWNPVFQAFSLFTNVKDWYIKASTFENNEKFNFKFERAWCSRFKHNKKYVIQEFYSCSTCFSGLKKTGVCRLCVEACHKDHKVQFLGIRFCFCDCGLNPDKQTCCFITCKKCEKRLEYSKKFSFKWYTCDKCGQNVNPSDGIHHCHGCNWGLCTKCL